MTLSLRDRFKLMSRSSVVSSNTNTGDTKTDDSMLYMLNRGGSIAEKINIYNRIYSMDSSLKQDHAENTDRLSSQSAEKHVVVCAVIIDKLYHSEIWKSWLDHPSSDETLQYRGDIVIHAKHPDKIADAWVRSKTLDHSFLPEWNSIEVIRALLAVLERGLQDEK